MYFRKSSLFSSFNGFFAYYEKYKSCHPIFTYMHVYMFNMHTYKYVSYRRQMDIMNTYIEIRLYICGEVF